MNRLALGTLFALLSLPLAAASARADRPTGSYVVRHPGYKAIGPGPQHRILYMHRDGGTVHAGDDDASSDSSTIPYGTSNVTGWELSDSAWAELMACVRLQYAPFDIEVTDVRPPAGSTYIGSWVGGYPQEVGMGNGVGGVSPMNDDCSVVEGAIVFTFAGVYGNDVQGICETVAQESGHALGMDHEYLCQDPMTYLYGCGAKSFQDEDVSCGEYNARQCMCGGSTQNSVQHLLAVLGPADTVGPEVAITAPQDGAEVPQGFTIESSATDTHGVTKVDLWLDGAYVSTAANAPYTFTAPTGLADGPHTVEVRAYDGAGNVSTAQVTARIVTDTGGDPGELGDPCSANADCTSGLCISDGTGGFCSQPCDPSASACPSGYACQSVGASGGVCWPTDPTDPGGDGDGDGEESGGCAVTGSSDAPTLGLFALFGLVFAASRRRRRR